MSVQNLEQDNTGQTTPAAEPAQNKRTSVGSISRVRVSETLSLGSSEIRDVLLPVSGHRPSAAGLITSHTM